MAAANRQRGSASARTHVAYPAKYASACGTCDERIAVGDLYVSTLVGGKRVYHHERCIHPDTAGTEADRIAELEQRAAELAGPIPNGRCHATTKAGKPCAGGAKHGELFCGPHLDQAVRAGSNAGTAHRSADRSADRSDVATADAPNDVPKPPAAYDPYYDDPF